MGFSERWFPVGKIYQSNPAQSAGHTVIFLKPKFRKGHPARFKFPWSLKSPEQQKTKRL
jgi:hypothetical protein